MQGAVAFSHQGALDRMSGDEALLNVVLTSFRSQAPLLIGLLRAALAAGDAPEVHRQLHTLAGSSAMVGADMLWARSAALEAIAAAGSMPQVERQLPALAVLISEFMTASNPAGGL